MDLYDDEEEFADFDDKRKKKADIPFKHFILNTLKEYCVYTSKTQSNSHQIPPLSTLEKIILKYSEGRGHLSDITNT